MLDVSKIREDFPLLERKTNDNLLIYFDHAATTQHVRTMYRTAQENLGLLNSLKGHFCKPLLVGPLLMFQLTL